MEKSGPGLCRAGYEGGNYRIRCSRLCKDPVSADVPPGITPPPPGPEHRPFRIFHRHQYSVRIRPADCRKSRRRRRGDCFHNPNISALSSGHHVIYHRVRDTTGDWSPTLSTPFFLEPGVDTQDDPEIEEMEVFYNTGNFPIGGSGTPIVVTTAGNVVTE